MPNVGTLKFRTIGFKQLSEAMAVSVPLALRTNLRLAFLSAGALVAGDAKELIDPYSQAIPESLKVRMSGFAAVMVGAGSKALPIAGLLEQGNQGSKDAEKFRHPVFGNMNVWVDQPTHPYLAPALKANEDEIQVLVETALDVAVAEGLITETLSEADA